MRGAAAAAAHLQVVARQVGGRVAQVVLRVEEQPPRAGRRAGIPVSLCGEMASNPLAVPILIGLGIEELSGTPSAVPIMKELVHALDAGVVAGDARCAREAGTAQEVHAIGAARLRESGLLEHPDIGSWLRSVVEEVEAGATTTGRSAPRRSP